MIDKVLASQDGSSVQGAKEKELTVYTGGRGGSLKLLSCSQAAPSVPGCQLFLSSEANFVLQECPGAEGWGELFWWGGILVKSCSIASPPPDI